MATGAAIFCLLTATPTASAEPGECTTVEPPTDSAGQLACADLRGMDLAQDDLSDANLRGADLRDAYLVQTDLARADLTGADLRGADLSQADLRDADLTGALLTGADARGADLTGADARGADLRNTDFSQADLRHADLRGADLRAADMTQADVDDLDLRGANLTDVESLAAETVRLDAAGLRGHRQISWLLFWPALALALVWWRARLRHLVRHRETTPIRAAEVVLAGAAILLAVGGLYLLATGAARAMTRQAMAWLPTVDPGPLSLFGAEPTPQRVSGAIALVIAGVLFLLARWRNRPRRATRTDQVVIGDPATTRRPAAVREPVRRVVRIAALAGTVDLVVVLVLKVLGELPAGGPWQDSGAWGHLATVGAATVVLVRLSRPDGTGSALASLSGVVLTGGGRDPYLMVAGRTTDDRPVSRVLPWHALTHVHLIRIRGTALASAAVVTLHEPGAATPTEYAKELHITGRHVKRLRDMLPAEMITDSVRAPSSD